MLLLPAIAIVAEIIPCNTRQPLWGYKTMVYAVLVLGFLTFIVWAHHMYLTGMGTVVTTFFQTTTVLISVPSVILLTCLMISLWGGSIRFNTAMLFACAFLPMFGIGGLTGLPLAFNLVDLLLHDTYYVIGHFHYVVAPGTLFGLFAGIYHWYPKITGRFMNEILGHLHFWPSLIFMNLIFAPMLLQGMAGFHRRWYDGGMAFEDTTQRIILWIERTHDRPSPPGASRSRRFLSSSTSSSASRAARRSPATIPGTPPPSSGTRRRLPGTATSSTIPSPTAGPTNTACPAPKHDYHAAVASRRREAVEDKLDATQISSFEVHRIDASPSNPVIDHLYPDLPNSDTLH